MKTSAVRFALLALAASTVTSILMDHTRPRSCATLSEYTLTHTHTHIHTLSQSVNGERRTAVLTKCKSDCTFIYRDTKINVNSISLS